MNDNINMASTIVGSMNACRSLTASKDGRICWFRTITLWTKTITSFLRPIFITHILCRCRLHNAVVQIAGEIWSSHNRLLLDICIFVFLSFTCVVLSV